MKINSNSFDPASIEAFPETAGVYLMKNHAGDVLYIGKAKNLRVLLIFNILKTARR